MKLPVILNVVLFDSSIPANWHSPMRACIIPPTSKAYKSHVTNLGFPHLVEMYMAVSPLHSHRVIGSNVSLKMFNLKTP